MARSGPAHVSRVLEGADWDVGGDSEVFTAASQRRYGVFDWSDVLLRSGEWCSESESTTFRVQGYYAV